MQGLKESLQGLREIYNIIPEGIIITDPQGKIVFLNRSLLEYIGSNEKRWLHKQSSSLFSGSTIQDRDRKSGNITEVVRLKFKSKKIPENSVKTLIIKLQSEDKSIGSVYISRLTEDDKDFQNHTLLNNPILKGLSLNKSEAFFVADIQAGRTLYCSEAAENVCGWSSTDFIEGGWAFSFIMVHPMDRNRIIKLMMEELSLRNAEPIIHDRVPIKSLYRFQTKDNKWIWIEDSVGVLERDNQGKVKLMIGSLCRFDPSDEEEKILAMSMLEDDVIYKDGKTYVNLETLMKIQQSNLKKMASDTAMVKDSFRLSNRENEILEYIVKGHSSEDISKRIHVTTNTVNMHRKQIMKKMNAKNLADLVRKSIEIGIINKTT
jgi:DNA-binding CsgD family transcriptional regulator/PAS domain-containing protein